MTRASRLTQFRNRRKRSLAYALLLSWALEKSSDRAAHLRALDFLATEDLDRSFSRGIVSFDPITAAIRRDAWERRGFSPV